MHFVMGIIAKYIFYTKLCKNHDFKYTLNLADVVVGSMISFLRRHLKAYICRMFNIIYMVN